MLNIFAVVSTVQIVIASVIRWLLIPRADAPGKILVLMIVGLALSEGVAFFGMFLIPADQPDLKLTLLILSLASIIQFAPIYARGTPATNPFQTG